MAASLAPARARAPRAAHFSRGPMSVTRSAPAGPSLCRACQSGQSCGHVAGRGSHGQRSSAAHCLGFQASPSNTIGKTSSSQQPGQPSWRDKVRLHVHQPRNRRGDAGKSKGREQTWRAPRSVETCPMCSMTLKRYPALVRPWRYAAACSRSAWIHSGSRWSGGRRAW